MDGGPRLARRRRARSPPRPWPTRPPTSPSASPRFEKQAEEQRTLEKKPALEAGRAIDAGLEAGHRRRKRGQGGAEAGDSSRSCWPNATASRSEGGGRADPPRAGTTGRRIGLRAVRHVRVTDRGAFVAAYRDDARLWASEDVDKVLLRLAEDDLAAGRAVAGAVLVETHVAA